MTHPLIGRSVGRYHIVEQLGEGGMALVFKAYDTHLECEVAIKFIRTDYLASAEKATMLKRFETEAKKTARLSHPNIVRVSDYGEFEGTPYLVMEYLAGGTLKERMGGSPLAPAEAARLLLPIAQALAYAHQQGIIHRDVKPANILLTDSGQPMLSDFGVAKILIRDEDRSSHLTGTGVGIGTPEYMAPEQVMGQAIDPRADIYALGVVLYELVTGRRPFVADTPMAVAVKHITDPLPRPQTFVPGLSEEVEHVLIKALAKQPQDRYPSMNDFAAALEKLLLDSGRVTVRPPSQPAPSMPSVQAAPPPARQVPRPAPPVISTAAPGPISAPGSQPGWQPRVKAASGKALWVGAGVVMLLGILALVLVGALILALRLRNPVSGQVSGQAAQSAELLATSTPFAPVFKTSDADGMVLAYIPAGPFLMGADASDDQAETNEKPVHEVHLDAFWIDRTEVTNGMYLKCVQAGRCNPPFYKTSATRNYYFGLSQYNNYPVIWVSWDDANAYCQWVGRRLPTEAEWEKAGRGSDGRRFPWGNDPPSGLLLNFADRNTAFDWSDPAQDDGYADTAPVGSYPAGASPYGVLDMAGNVWEWVADWYSESYYAHSPAANPSGPQEGEKRLIRGGGWSNSGRTARLAHREGVDPNLRENDIGFRCAVSE